MKDKKICIQENKRRKNQEELFIRYSFKMGVLNEKRCKK